MSDALQNRNIVIIGGTGGLGRAATEALLTAGACVVAVGRDDEHLARTRAELGSAADRLILNPAEATDPSAAPLAIAEAVNRFGPLHGLLHVAGGSGRRHGDGPLHEVTDEGWRRTLNLNLDSVFYSNRAAVQQFLRQGTGGSIVDLGSVLAWAPSTRYFSTLAYAAAKAALIGLIRSAAAQYASRNVRFNLLAPGLVATPMSLRAQEDVSIREFIATKQPLDGGRMGQPQDVTGAAVYLLSDASRFVTGQVLAIDGGWCLADGQWGVGRHDGANGP
jgi:NAD(P)-dependent dehydrogenase (short-subunit alcohol dehydrogenase family)